MPNFCPECGKHRDECTGHSSESGAGDDLKALLDAIPSPGDAKSAPKPAATAEPAGLSLKDQLDAIPDPGSGASGVRPAYEGGGRKDDTPEWMKNYDNARKSSTAGAPGAVSNDSAIRNQLDSIPAPGGGGGAPPAGADGEVPQWMKNYQSHQSAGQAGGGPLPNPDSYVPRGDAPPATGGGSMQMIAILLVVLCIAFVGFLITNKPAPPNFDSAGSSSSSPAPGTPSQ